MSDPELLLLGTLRAVAEVAMLFLLGRGLLALLAGSRRHDNAIYALFTLLTRPAIALTRKLAPPQILDRHLPAVSFALLFWAWIGLAYLKRLYCETSLASCT